MRDRHCISARQQRTTHAGTAAQARGACAVRAVRAHEAGGACARGGRCVRTRRAVRAHEAGMTASLDDGIGNRAAAARLDSVRVEK
jgi:hypothetical protein